MHADAAVPLERWDTDVFALNSPNALDASFGSFISGAQHFDAAAFGISQAEAIYMDPQQRILLEHARELLVPTQGTPTIATAARTAVMLGIGPTEYLHLTKQSLPMGLYSATGVAISVAAGRYIVGQPFINSRFKMGHCYPELTMVLFTAG